MEAIRKVERMESGDHLQAKWIQSDSNEGHRRCQMLMGILVWVATIKGIDVACLASTPSLSWFMGRPCQGHEDQALCVLGYFKKQPNRHEVVDSRDPVYRGGKDALDLDFTKELASNYLDAFEEIDYQFLEDTCRRDGDYFFRGFGSCPR